MLYSPEVAEGRKIWMGGNTIVGWLSISTYVLYSIIDKSGGRDMDPLSPCPNPPIPAPLCAATALSENRYISTFPQLIQHNYRAPFLTTNHYVVGLWQYGLWSFQTGYIKSERFLPKNQYTQRKF